MLETGKPLSIKMEPPKEMMAAVQQAVAEQAVAQIEFLAVQRA